MMNTINAADRNWPTAIVAIRATVTKTLTVIFRWYKSLNPETKRVYPPKSVAARAIPPLT